MKSLLAPARGIGGLDRVDLTVQLLEDEWRRHGEADLKRIWMDQRAHLVVEDDDPIALLSELIKTDLHADMRGGKPLR